MTDNCEPEMSTLAQSKLDYLRERGYEQVAVVMSRGEGDCAVVSNSGRVTWHGEATDQYIRGERAAVDAAMGLGDDE